MSPHYSLDSSQVIESPAAKPVRAASSFRLPEATHHQLQVWTLNPFLEASLGQRTPASIAQREFAYSFKHCFDQFLLDLVGSFTDGVVARDRPLDRLAAGRPIEGLEAQRVVEYRRNEPFEAIEACYRVVPHQDQEVLPD